jgi:protein-S-isoprenylcysteine O-methyltransferase Ste14
MSTGRGRSGWSTLAGQVVLLIAIVLVPPADHWPTPDWLLVVASVLTLGGMVVVVMGSLRLGRSLAASPAARTHAPLQTDGLYRWVRHPVYSGLLALVVGVAIRSGNMLAAMLAVVIVIFFNRRAAREEAQLRERSPAYDAYASVTPRFFPNPMNGRARRDPTR